MDAESFTDLALRVIAREATDDDRRALDAELAAVPSRRDEFDQLKITHEILRTTAPMSHATHAIEPVLPAYRVNELRTAVRQHFGPAVSRGRSDATRGAIVPILRWLFAGSGAGALAFAIMIFCFANQTIEIGQYGAGTVRGDQGLSASDVPAAKIVAFDQDAPFDRWQNQPLAWNEHAKIWVDNEKDILHVVTRVRHGQIRSETVPLAPTADGQREQIKQLVESLKN